MAKHLVKNMPSKPVMGDEYFDLSDGVIKVPGENTVHEFGKGSGGSAGFQPYWCGRVLSTGQLTKMSGSGNISVWHTATGVYSVKGASPGMSVTVTPLNFTNSLVTLEPLTAAILQNSSNGLITIHIFDSSGTRVNSAFSLLII